MRRNIKTLTKRGRMKIPSNPPKAEHVFSAVVGVIPQRPASSVKLNACGSLSVWGSTGRMLGTIPTECQRVHWPGYSREGG